MPERARELRRRRARSAKLGKLAKRLTRARTRDEKQRLVTKMARIAPWRLAEFQKLLS
jgi:hypothetical protein